MSLYDSLARAFSKTSPNLVTTATDILKVGVSGLISWGTTVGAEAAGMSPTFIPILAAGIPAITCLAARVFEDRSAIAYYNKDPRDLGEEEPLYYAKTLSNTDDRIRAESSINKYRSNLQGRGFFGALYTDMAIPTLASYGIYTLLGVSGALGSFPKILKDWTPGLLSGLAAAISQRTDQIQRNSLTSAAYESAYRPRQSMI